MDTSTNMEITSLAPMIDPSCSYMSIFVIKNSITYHDYSRKCILTKM